MEFNPDLRAIRRVLIFTLATATKSLIIALGWNLPI